MPANRPPFLWALTSSRGERTDREGKLTKLQPFYISLRLQGTLDSFVFTLDNLMTPLL